MLRSLDLRGERDRGSKRPGPSHGALVFSRLVTGWLLGFALVACDRSADEARRVEAAVESLRALPQTPREPRRRAVESLRALEVGSDRARAARDACSKAYRTLDDAHELTDEVEGSMKRSDGGKPLPDPLLVAAKLRRADELLEESREAMRACELATRELAAPH